MTTENLVAALGAAGALPAAWREAFLAVPRHAFLPAKIWVDDGDGEPRPLDRDTKPDEWWESAYANVAIVTQFDDGATVWPAVGTHRTSSASEPAMVATMLEFLDARVGQRVLDIGGFSTSAGSRHRRVLDIGGFSTSGPVPGIMRRCWRTGSVRLR